VALEESAELGGFFKRHSASEAFFKRLIGKWDASNSFVSANAGERRNAVSITVCCKFNVLREVILEIFIFCVFK